MGVHSTSFFSFFFLEEKGGGGQYSVLWCLGLSTMSSLILSVEIKKLLSTYRNKATAVREVN